MAQIDIFNNKQKNITMFQTNPSGDKITPLLRIYPFFGTEQDYERGSSSILDETLLNNNTITWDSSDLSVLQIEDLEPDTEAYVPDPFSKQINLINPGTATITCSFTYNNHPFRFTINATVEESEPQAE